MSTVRFCSFK